jgi:hypothetical protein
MPSLVQADQLDLRLHESMPRVIEQLQKKYKNVGILRFRVQDKNKDPQFDPPLCGRLAERVETLLIVHNDPDEAKALGIIHQASMAAARKGIGAWFTQKDERRKLFAERYPLAWGNTLVAADAFVTGKVVLSKDRKKTTVTLECFDKDDPTKMYELSATTIDTDRFILRDLGYSFALSKQSKTALAGGSTLQDEDRHFVEIVERTQSAETRPEEKSQPGNIGGIAVQVLVNDKPISIRPGSTRGDGIAWQLDCPPAKSEVMIRLRNTTDRTLGVVLRLNGINTIHEQNADPEEAAKWVIPARRSYLIKGFYPARGGSKKEKESNGASVKPFTVLVAEDARKIAIELGDKAGLIEIDVFEEGPPKKEVLLISPKGLPPSKEKEARSSYLGLRSALIKSSKLKTTTVVVKNDAGVVTKKSIIVPDTDAIDAGQDLETTEFRHPRLVSRLSIKVMPTEKLSEDD